MDQLVPDDTPIEIKAQLDGGREIAKLRWLIQSMVLLGHTLTAAGRIRERLRFLRWPDRISHLLQTLSLNLSLGPASPDRNANNLAYCNPCASY